MRGGQRGGAGALVQGHQLAGVDVAVVQQLAGQRGDLGLLAGLLGDKGFEQGKAGVEVGVHAAHRADARWRRHRPMEPSAGPSGGHRLDWRPVGTALPPQRRFALAFWLAALLLAAQALGLAHRVLHAPGLAGEPVLFGAHAHGDAECRLVDHACGDLALPAAPVLPPAQPAPAAPAALVAEAVHGRVTAPYLARGPPQG